MPTLNTTFDAKQLAAFYTNEAKMYEGFARRATDQASQKAFKDKANELWLRVVELRGA